MQTKEQLRSVTADLFEQLRQDNVIYAEIRFAPLLHTEKGLFAEEVLGTVNETLEGASQASGVEARLSWRSVEDSTLLEHLRQHHIHLEVCPTSNVHVYQQPFKTYSDHPVDTIHDSGISTSVNSDARTLIAVTLTEEY